VRTVETQNDDDDDDDDDGSVGLLTAQHFTSHAEENLETQSGKSSSSGEKMAESEGFG
jgi:hypothetical protein